MPVFELVLALLLGGVILASIAPWLRVPWPALVALAGAGLAFVPGVPEVSLDPELALALFVAPVLLDAAFDASPRDLRANWVPLTSLIVVLVLLTMVAVAATSRAMMPGLPWAAALALGAIVAPPDAAAATSVLRTVALPHRLLVILEGEGLLNDAPALIAYRVAVGAATGEDLTGWAIPLLVLSACGGLLIGVVLARAYFFLARRLRRGPEATVMQFLGTFGVWLLADALHLSPVLTVVAYAITIARTAPTRLGARERRSAYAVWEVVVFTLNLLAFILVGLQLRGILDRLDGGVLHYAGFAAGVLATTVGVRAAWVMGYGTFLRWRHRRFGPTPAEKLMPPTVAGGVVIAWCGMRGIVSIATALALPQHFPERDLLVFAAFGVVLGTLVLQGLTLRTLLARLVLPADESIDRELELAREELARAALEALGEDRRTEAGRVLALEYKARLPETAAEDRSDPTGRFVLRQRAISAERQRLLKLRDRGTIGDDAFHLIEEELDWAEAEGDTGS